MQLSSTQWNYTASNQNDGRVGDGWNQEDLSIFSADQADPSAGLDSGGRAVSGFCRPYARAVQGRLNALQFDQGAGSLSLEYSANDKLSAPTEIYLPHLHFPAGYRVEVVGTRVRQLVDGPGQRLLLWASESGPVRVSITRQPSPMA